MFYFNFMLQNAISKIEIEKAFRAIHRPYKFSDDYEDAKEQEEASKQALLSFVHTILKAAAEEIGEGKYKFNCECEEFCSHNELWGYNKAIDDCQAKLLKVIKE